jgi:hypothetical protein
MGTAHPNADVPAPADVAGTSEVPAKPSTRAPHPTPRRQP